MILVLVCSLLSFKALAADLYVSTSGSDSNPGTQSAPFKTIAKAGSLGVASPGTTIHVAPGVYKGSITTSASGTASARIRYVSDTKWGAKIVGSGSSRIWINLGNYVTIDGFDVSGANNTGGLASGPWNGGEMGYYFTATNNYIHDVAVGVCGSSGAISVFSTTGHSIITNNIIKNIDVANITSGHCSTMQGIYIADVYSYVANNLVSGVAAVGIQQWHGASHSTIVNNTVFNCSMGFLIGSGDSGTLPGGSQYNYVANNISYDNVYYGFIEDNLTSHNTYVNNLSFKSAHQNWYNVAGAVSGTITADPMFVNYKADGSGDYHLQSGSPAIGKGNSLDVPMTDIFGAPRVAGSIDLGVYAGNKSPVPTPTPTPVPKPTPTPAPTPTPVPKRILNFGNQVVGTTSAAQIVTLKNTGNVAISIPSAFIITGDFAFGGIGTCKLISYAPGESCTASLVFKPTLAGIRTGTISMLTTASSVPMLVKLSGNYLVPPPLPTPTPSSTPKPTPTPTPTPTPSPTPTSLYSLYVSTNGSDSNSGSLSAPLKTILKASTLAKPGTSIYVAPGTYIGGFTTLPSGTASARIIYRSTTKWGAKIIPSSSLSSLNAMWINRGSYVTIDGFELDGSSAKVMYRNGIVTSGSNVIYQNNHVHHIGNTNVCNGSGGSGLDADDSLQGVNIEIYNNIVNNIGPAGCSHFYHGIYLSTTGKIKNNITFMNPGGGIHLWHDASHVDIVNNTSFANGIGIIIGSGNYYTQPASPGDYCNVQNNIVFDNSIQGISEEGITGTHNTYINNLVYQNVVNWQHHNGTTDSGTLVANPKFVNYIRTGGGDYHLQSTSPAINKGAQTYAPATDIDGKVRPVGAVDLGAYEF